MIRPQRKLHLIAWLILLPVLAIVVYAAIMDRETLPVSEAPFAESSEVLP